MPLVSAQYIVGSLKVPVALLAAAGYPAYTLSAALSYLQRVCQVTQSAPVLNAYRTWVYNTRKHAPIGVWPRVRIQLIHYFQRSDPSRRPNASCARPAGLDNATPITARARTGQEGFGSSFHKRVPRIYVSGTFTGDMLFRTITAESGRRTYSLPSNAVCCYSSAASCGQRPAADSGSFEIENVAGADFGINDIWCIRRPSNAGSSNAPAYASRSWREIYLRWAERKLIFFHARWRAPRAHASAHNPGQRWCDDLYQLCGARQGSLG